jgi:hypothetical protein
VEGVRGEPFAVRPDAARRGAEQRQAFDALGGRHGQLLGDHATEADADQAERAPADVVGEGEGVGRVVGHRGLVVGHRRLAEASLIVGEQVEPLGEGGEQHSARLQGRARTVQEQQAGAVAAPLEVDVDPPERDGRHRPIQSAAALAWPGWDS